MEKELLITHDNVNCANLSKEEFVNMMSEDIIKSVEVYDDRHYQEAVEYFNKCKASSIEWTKKRATEYANKKWKTEKKRNEYIAKEVEKETEEQKTRKMFYDNVCFYDFDLNPSDNCLSADCCIDFEGKDSNDYSKLKTNLAYCYEAIKDNKYWKRGLGWKLYAYSRPQIELILPDEVQKEFNAEEKALAEDIRRFYADCHYWGD